MVEKHDSLEPNSSPKNLQPPRVKGRLLRAPFVLFVGVLVVVVSLLIIEIYRADAKRRVTKKEQPVTDPVVTHKEPLKSSVVPQKILEDSLKITRSKAIQQKEVAPKHRELEVGQFIYNENGMTKVSYSPDPDLLQEPIEKQVQGEGVEEKKLRLKRYQAALKSPMVVASLDSQYQTYQKTSYSGVNRVPPANGVDSAANLMANLTKKEDLNKQERKESYSKTVDSTGYLQYKKQKPLSPYQINKGWTIPAVLTTGINTDLPGVIKAQVSQNVYDTATGQHLLIPQGSVVVGDYDHFIALGQRRAMLAWRELIFPDGSNLNLVSMAGQDRAGYAGLEDIVNNHYLRTFGSALLMSVIGAGFQLSQAPAKSSLDPRSIFTAEMGRNGSQVANEIIRQNIKRQPQLKIRPGKRVMITVNRHIVLEPIN